MTDLHLKMEDAFKRAKIALNKCPKTVLDSNTQRQIEQTHTAIREYFNIVDKAIKTSRHSTLQFSKRKSR